MKSVVTEKSKPVVIYAKDSKERDFLRYTVGVCNRVVCFEKENICCDNLASLDPQLILLRTDAKETIWRFMLVLDALKIDSEILLLSNRFDGHSFNTDNHNLLHTFSNFHETRPLQEKLNAILKNDGSMKDHRRRRVLFGSSPTMKGLASKLPGLSQTSDPILIEGEKGAGKESLAKMIAQSNGRSSIFIKVDCEAIAAGREGFYDLFSAIVYSESEKVRGNPTTVLFSEIDRLDPKSQSEVLLILEGDLKNQKTNQHYLPGLRVIATSEVDLACRVRENRFRSDLYYRINVIPIQLPALRDRKEDIPLFMDYFAIEACIALKRSFLFPTPYLSELFCSYPWPGNLGELKNAMHRLAISGSEDQLLRQLGFNNPSQDRYRCLHNAIGKDIFPDSYEIQNCLATLNGASLKAICNKFSHKTEQTLLRKALEITNWNRKKAAALLNISYKSMLNKMKMYEIM